MPEREHPEALHPVGEQHDHRELPAPPVHAVEEREAARGALAAGAEAAPGGDAPAPHVEAPLFVVVVVGHAIYDTQTSQ